MAARRAGKNCPGCLGVSGVCSNATAPSVSSINRILRNRAAERAAAEFARAAGYGLYAAGPHPYFNSGHQHPTTSHHLPAGWPAPGAAAHPWMLPPLATGISGAASALLLPPSLSPGAAAAAAAAASASAAGAPDHSLHADAIARGYLQGDCRFDDEGEGERERERESGRMVVFLRRRRRGRRKPGRVGAAEIPAESYDVQPGTAGGAREGIRTISLSLRVDAGAAGVEDVSFGGSCAGEGSIPSKISLSGELERFRFAGLALDLFSPFLLPLSLSLSLPRASILEKWGREKGHALQSWRRA